MAQQKGIIPLKGTIGNITFYKSSDGYLAREKGGVDANRIQTDPAFQRTRENGAEFGRAGKATKLLRNAIRGLTQNAADGKMSSRLTKAMLKVIQADATNARGLRNVIDGEVELLTGFEFNINSKLSTTLYAAFTATIDDPAFRADFAKTGLDLAPLAGARLQTLVEAQEDVSPKLVEEARGLVATKQ